MVKHIKILGKANAERLGNETIIRQAMIDLIRQVGMQPLGDPIVHNVPLEIEKLGREPFEDEGGITTQIVGCHTLSTSHIAIHTWPLREEFILDLFSCRFYEQADVCRFLHDVLHCSAMKVHDLTFACEWS